MIYSVTICSPNKMITFEMDNHFCQNYLSNKHMSVYNLIGEVHSRILKF